MPKLLQRYMKVRLGNEVCVLWSSVPVCLVAQQILCVCSAEYGCVTVIMFLFSPLFLYGFSCVSCNWVPVCVGL